MKTTVDQFKPGQKIPHCHLKAEVTSNHKMPAPKLFHQVKLVGAKDPYNTVTISLDPQETLPGQNTPSYLSVSVYGFCVESVQGVLVLSHSFFTISSTICCHHLACVH